MRPRNRNRDDRPAFEAAPPQVERLTSSSTDASRGMLDVLRGLGLRLAMVCEAWADRRLSKASAAVIFRSPLEDRIQFSERLTAILLMIPSAGTAVLTYYCVAGPLTETGSTAIQKGQAVGFALTIGVFIWLGWFYLFGLIHRLDGPRLRNALIAGGLMVLTIAVIDAPFNMLALAGGPAAQMSLVAMTHAYELRRDALIAGVTALRRLLPAIKVQAVRFARLKTQEEKSGTYSGKGKPGKVSASFGQVADLLGGLGNELDTGLGRTDALQGELTAAFGRLKSYAYQQGPIRDRMEGASSAADGIDTLLARAGQYDFGASIESTLASLDTSLLRPQGATDAFAQTQATEVAAVAAMARPVADSLRASLAELRGLDTTRRLGAVETRAEAIKQRFYDHFARHEDGWVAAEALKLAANRSYPVLQHPAPKGFGPTTSGPDVAELMMTKARQTVHARAIGRMMTINTIKHNLQNALIRNRPRLAGTQSQSPANDAVRKQSLRNSNS